MASRWLRHPATWIFAPTFLALLYYLGHTLLAAEPTLGDLPPKEAVLVQRFRSLEVFDRMQPPSRKAPSTALGEALNIPGLSGVDRAGPVHLIQLPRRGLTVRSLVVLSVENGDALDARFHDVELIEQGFVRHAQHMHRMGGWAAFSPDRSITRRLGEGGLTAADRNEDYSLAADIPLLVDHALTMPHAEPWRGVLESLGVRATVQRDGQTPRVAFEGTGHLRRLQTSWAEARMWAWFAKDGAPYVEVLAETQAGIIRRVLEALRSPQEDVAPVPVPRTADAWVRIPHGQARGALALALFSLGFSFGQSADVSGDAVPPAIAALSKSQAPGGLAIWTEPSVRAPGTFDIAAAAPAGSMPDPTKWVPADQPQLRTIEGLDVAAGGPDGERILDRYRAAVLADRARISTWKPDAGEHVLATFRFSAERAKAWLGGLVGPGGLWGLFQDRDMDGIITTDGRRLRIRIRGVAAGS